MESVESSSVSRLLKPIIMVSSAYLICVSLYIFLWPAGIVISRLMDSDIKGENSPKWVVRHFKRLAPLYGDWARERVSSRAAVKLAIDDISGTEWPLFGTVFFLWTAEELHIKGEIDSTSPEVRNAIDAALALVLDPNHAHWVKDHWGNDYMNRQNAFYRLLRISAMVSHHNITGETDYLPMLREETVSLMKEIDESPTGLIEDYPGECYPCDVVAAVATINRASKVLEIDCRDFLRRARRGFNGKALDSRGMVPYFADATGGNAIGPTRGCSNSYICLSAPDAFPDLAKTWYSDYETHFWQDNWGARGFREFPKDMPDRDWYFDIDAGPVVAGHGVAASAFGVGAARLNGRLDHAYPLSCELIAFSWPLPHGTLYFPRILSNAADAPYLGEASILYSLTRSPHASVSIRKGGRRPLIVYLMLLVYIGPGLILSYLAIARLRYALRQNRVQAPYLNFQVLLWVFLLAFALVSLSQGTAQAVVVGLLTACIPFGLTRAPSKNKSSA